MLQGEGIDVVVGLVGVKGRDDARMRVLIVKQLITPLIGRQTGALIVIRLVSALSE